MTVTEKKLYAGPWSGELGWEICSWNPCMRHIAQDYDHVTVETQPGMEYLYEFADEIIINPRKPNFDMYKGEPSNPPFQPDKDTFCWTPMGFWRQHTKNEFQVIKNAVRGRSKNLHPKKWRQYGTESPRKVATIMCAWRGKKRFKNRSYPEKQYPDDRCIALTQSFLEAGYDVACYGGEDNLYVEGTIDFRGVPLQELCGALSQASLAIGPSSGTIHLASLCGTPHVTWYGRPVVSMDRYLTYWNPFSTPTTFLDGDCPPVEKAFLHGIERLNPQTETLNWIEQ